MEKVKFKPRYSGPGRSGICVCGHLWKKHHLGMVLNTEYYEATKEAYVPQECEHYGVNEYSGLDAQGRPHCGSYSDRGVKKKNKKRKENNDDARDYMNSAYFLLRLSNKALAAVLTLKPGEARQRMKDGAYPFSRLSGKNRESLCHLPTSWVYGSARHLLYARKD